MTEGKIQEGRFGWVRKISPIKAAYIAVVVVFLAAVGQFYIPGRGFTYLIGFGSRQESKRLTKLQQLDYYVAQRSDGYDAQYYAQMALDPSLTNSQLKQAIDSLAYRGRRILMPAVAYVMGLGKPVRVVQAFALINPLCWLALAVLLLHWFPPRDWRNFLRWAGVLFSTGLTMSVRYALIDGPSLLLIAIGVLLVEKGRPWIGNTVLAVSGLAKETNLIGGAALLPARWPGLRGGALVAVRGVLLVAPLGLWMLYMSATLGPATSVGLHNFNLPFISYVHQWRDVLASWPTLTAQNFNPVYAILFLVALTAQMLFLMLRPRWATIWWRIGASFALLMLILGDAVWEGFPGAATRVLLPMQLAFNVLVPGGRRWLPVLLAGNLTLLGAPWALQGPDGPAGQGYYLSGSTSLMTNDSGKAVTVKFSPEWYATESGANSNYWTWAPGDAAVALVNPHQQPLELRLRFGLCAVSQRVIHVRLNGQELWQATVPGEGEVTAALSRVSLAPGNNRLEFVTDAPGVTGEEDSRLLSFNLRNFRIEVQRFTPAGAKEGIQIVGRGFELNGDSALLSSGNGRSVAVKYTAGWYDLEQDKGPEFWTWSQGRSALTIFNPHPAPLLIRFRCGLAAIRPRLVRLELAGQELGEFAVPVPGESAVDLKEMVLPPGENTVKFVSDQPPDTLPADSRQLAFSLKNLRIYVLGLAPAAGKAASDRTE